MTTKCIPLNQASLYYCIFIKIKKAGNVTSRTTADVEIFLFELIYFVLFGFWFSS